jgi:hypothetical protein
MQGTGSGRDDGTGLFMRLLTGGIAAADRQRFGLPPDLPWRHPAPTAFPRKFEQGGLQFAKSAAS